VGWVRRQVHGEFQATFAVGAALAGAVIVAFFCGFEEDVVKAPSAAAASIMDVEGRVPAE
jgi:hypothetical protein